MQRSDIRGAHRELRVVKYLKERTAVPEEKLMKISGIKINELDGIVDEGYIERIASENGNAYSLSDKGLIIANQFRGSILGYLYQALSDSMSRLK